MMLSGPTRVEQFSPPVDSLKSTEPGDTVQIPNTEAFFTYFYRKDIIPFYKKDFGSKFNYFGVNLPFLTLNYPPQYANEAIRPYILSWYLEEFVHPLRESLYVNGWEPYDEQGNPRLKNVHGIVIEDRSFDTKITLRYFYSPLWVRIIVWLGIVLSIALLFKLYKRIWQYD